MNEVQLLKSMKHPNILECYEWWTVEKVGTFACACVCTGVPLWARASVLSVCVVRVRACVHRVRVCMCVCVCVCAYSIDITCLSCAHTYVHMRTRTVHIHPHTHPRTRTHTGSGQRARRQQHSVCDGHFDWGHTEAVPQDRKVHQAVRNTELVKADRRRCVVFGRVRVCVRVWMRTGALMCVLK